LLRYSKIKEIDRIIDANINRAKEGLRVCEEIVRFILNSRPLASETKKIRHEIEAIIKGLIRPGDLLKSRKASLDVGRDIYVHELKRRNLGDIFFANIQRVKESVRVLEEFSKLINIDSAIKFKKLRYRIYEIEKKIAKRIVK